MAIYFYLPRDKNGYLSNFSSFGFELEGEWWSTVEHYFQAKKFTDLEYIKKISNTKDPTIVAKMGQTRKYAIRSDWDSIKVSVMKKAVLKKFQTHACLRKSLLSTGNEEIIENAHNDFFWGVGSDGSGRNELGIILRNIRSFLRTDCSRPN